MISLKFFETPVGSMRAGATDAGICLFDFHYRHRIDGIAARIESALGDTFAEAEHPYFDRLKQQVDEYFAGARKEFDLPLNLVGSPFQVKVWEALLQIPYGETRSYKQQSIAVGDEKAIRAVASANGDNGIAIIVPCHRVIGSNGSLTGYGGGLSKKKFLLELERKHSGKSAQAELF